jgi:hypothetical protein
MKLPKKCKAAHGNGGRERDPATHPNAQNSFTQKELPKIELHRISKFSK